ncbi:hypothetical protein GCK32_002568, partial [Trichostrongylus colubriformis]
FQNKMVKNIVVLTTLLLAAAHCDLGRSFCKRGNHATNSTAFSTCEASSCAVHNSEAHTIRCQRT